MASLTVKELVEKGDRASVVDGFGNLKGHSPRMLSPENLLAEKRPHLLGGKKIIQQHMPEFLASSSLLHAEDAASYLGRAIGALQRGSYGTAYHLAYYAELRAAISILASAGVLIGNGFLGILDKDGNYFSKRSFSGLGTHMNTWKVVNLWFQQSRATAMLGESFTPFGISLREWLNSASTVYRQAIDPLAQKWLGHWSLDLERFTGQGGDRDRRNLVSYQPTRLRNFTKVDATKFTQDYWELCQPLDRGRLESFDQVLLGLLMDELRESVKLNAITSNTVDSTGADLLVLERDEAFKEAIRDQGTTGSWEVALFGSARPKLHPVFELAKVEDFDPRTVISRATILFRIACASTHRNSTDALGTNSSDLATWARTLLAERGIELDPKLSISDLRGSIDSNLVELSAGADLLSIRCDGVRLDSAELVCAWAIAT